MFIQQALDNPTWYFSVIVTVILSITLHELAHGYTALRYGDHTGRLGGHLTLNPLVHMPPFAFLTLFLAGIAWGSMPIDPTRMKGRYAESAVAIAGPLTNLVLAALALTALGLWQRAVPDAPGFRVVNTWNFLLVFGSVNLALCAFNLIPIPPLDGSHILSNLNEDYRRFWSDPSRQGVAVGLFIGAFILARYLFRGTNFLAHQYVQWLNLGQWTWG